MACRERVPSRAKEAGTEAKNGHDERDLGQALTLAGKADGCSEGWPDARAPHDAEQQAKDELAAQSIQGDPGQRSLACTGNS